MKMFPEWYMHLPTHSQVSHQNYATRHQDKLHVPLTHTDSGGRSLAVLDPRVWSDLPPHVVDSSTLSGLKKRLRDFLKNNDNTHL